MPFPPPRTQEGTGPRDSQRPGGTSNSSNLLLFQLRVLVQVWGSVKKEDFTYLISRLLFISLVSHLDRGFESRKPSTCCLCFLVKIPTFLLPEWEGITALALHISKPLKKAGQRVSTSPKL